MPFSSSLPSGPGEGEPGGRPFEHRRLLVWRGRRRADHDFSNPEMAEIQVPTPWQGLVRQELSSCRCRQLAE